MPWSSRLGFRCGASNPVPLKRRRRKKKTAVDATETASKEES